MTLMTALLCTLIFAIVVYAEYAVPDEMEREDLSAYSELPGLTFSSGLQTVSVSLPSKTPRELSLFGVIPVKTVYLHNHGQRSVALGGTPFGCVLDIKNILVVGLSDIKTQYGMKNPAQEAGIRVGDTLIECNGSPLEQTKDLAACVKKSADSPVQLTIMRKGKKETVRVAPAFDVDEKCYKLGLWVRDSEAGVGIVSFCDEESGVSVGLGHALKDSDTGTDPVIDGGTAYHAKILNVEKGSAGSPGQLSGCIQAGQAVGSVISNEDYGVFFTGAEPMDTNSVEVAFPEEVVTGDAELVIAVETNDPQSYRVRIVSVQESDNERKNLFLSVTDKQLLSLTGGIVQGMSGSPILQNGKLVGVLTHVLVDDPTSGYGIFADSLLSRARALREGSSNLAS